MAKRKSKNESDITIAGTVETKAFANVKTKKYVSSQLQVLQCLKNNQMVFAIPEDDAMKLIDNTKAQQSICKSFTNIDK